MARNYAVLLHEYREEFSPLSDEEVGRLVRALLDFSISGAEPELPGNERFLAKRVYSQELRFQAHYDQLAQVRSAAGRRGVGIPAWQTVAKMGIPIPKPTPIPIPIPI